MTKLEQRWEIVLESLQKQTNKQTNNNNNNKTRAHLLKENVETGPSSAECHQLTGAEELVSPRHMLPGQ